MKLISKRMGTQAAAFALCSGLFLACGEDKPKLDTQVEVNDPQDDAFADNAGLEDDYYMVPSPNEFFRLVKNSNLEYSEELLNEPHGLPSGKKLLALKFGKTISDLAYASSFDNYEKASENFNKMRELATELDVTYIFTEVLLDRIKSNLTNSDSLELISQDSYFNIINYLERNEKGDLMAMMSAGGWVESLYLVMSMASSPAESPDVANQIANQKATLENLLALLEKYGNDPDVKSIHDDFEAIYAVYEQHVEHEPTTVKKVNGRVVIGGGSKSLTDQEFNELKNKVLVLREQYFGQK